MYYKIDNVDLFKLEEINIIEMVDDIKSFIKISSNIEINCISDNTIIKANKYALFQILINLIENGVKYNDKDTIKVDVL